ncbi:MAG: hypothetical protein JXR51_09855 [Bacteroidales bacterium]|nr:hypothetical protein [Bacteroidales bacterium]MBN2757469.1 hypothetical protein [Bacteroidales bacterium]
MKLIFKLKADERKWDVYLSEMLGEEIAKKCSFEVDATASEHWARVLILNFNNDKALLDKLEKNENVISAYLVENKVITKRIR